MAKFKVYAYIFGGIFLIFAMVNNAISEFMEEHSFYSSIFNAIFIFVGIIWIKEGLKKRKALKETEA